LVEVAGGYAVTHRDERGSGGGHVKIFDAKLAGYAFG
jgi:hypothetical protein